MNLLALTLLPASVVVQDTVVVEANGPGLWGVVSLTEEVVIGSLDGAEEYTFGLIRSTALGLDGTIFVNDVQVPVIRRYDSSGRYLGPVGREGQGPGEYGQVLGTKILPDGRLAAWDPRNIRVTLFTPDGEYDSSHRAHSGLFSSDVFQVDTAGVFYVKTTLSFGERPGDEWVMGWIRVAPDGHVIDTIPIPPPGGGGGFVLATAEGRRRPFPTQFFQSISPHGYTISGRNSDYSFSRPLPDGRTLLIRRDYEPVPLHEDERQQWQDYADYFASLSRDANYTKVRIPRVKPPYRALFADADGRIWVSRYVTASAVELSEEYVRERAGRPLYRWREPPTWDVFDPRGDFLGTVVMPRDSYPSYVRGDVILATRRGEFSEGYVVMLRIEPTR